MNLSFCTLRGKIFALLWNCRLHNEASDASLRKRKISLTISKNLVKSTLAEASIYCRLGKNVHIGLKWTFAYWTVIRFVVQMTNQPERVKEPRQISDWTQAETDFARNVCFSFWNTAVKQYGVRKTTPAANIPATSQSAPIMGGHTAQDGDGKTFHDLI